MKVQEGEGYSLHNTANPYIHEKKVKVAQVVSDSAIPWTIQSMEFSRPECWSG